MVSGLLVFVLEILLLLRPRPEAEARALRVEASPQLAAPCTPAPTTAARCHPRTPPRHPHPHHPLPRSCAPSACCSTTSRAAWTWARCARAAWRSWSTWCRGAAWTSGSRACGWRGCRAGTAWARRARRSGCTTLRQPRWGVGGWCWLGRWLGRWGGQWSAGWGAGCWQGPGSRALAAAWAARAWLRLASPSALHPPNHPPCAGTQVCGGPRAHQLPLPRGQRGRKPGGGPRSAAVCGGRLEERPRRPPARRARRGRGRRFGRRAPGPGRPRRAAQPAAAALDGQLCARAHV
jgi:hypothetical protein